jgi:putative phosphoribosyl transferase
VAALTGHLRAPGLLVLSLPRGGVPVGAVVARALGAPLDVVVVRKVPAPGQPELALGAVTWEGVRAENLDVRQAAGLPEAVFEQLVAAQSREVERRTHAYRGARPLPDVRGRPIVLVDDGVATGATVRAAVAWLRRHGAGRVALAVPVVGADVARELRGWVDELVSVITPDDLIAVGLYYQDFAPVPDAEVVRLLSG